ncbi:DUF3558 domain-containing protein [Nocardia macrotermitis]|uniref:DUF3558 domain-containing protein n=1 Tax=Nocardia macrotermitis TaxID=2585198 RepID=A0A7K0D4E9_9NOCA|nr:DUF3558 domain-containing protein [Nocardia macrotermitis]MQY20441.1 hypothetical protein [Nocardia macrotermitis]
MTSSRRALCCTAAVIGVATLVAGCQGGGSTSAGGSTQAAATSAIAPDAPTGFDGCKLPQSVIDSEHLGSDPDRSDSAGDGGIKWRGCIWVADNGDGYGANIRTTNITIPAIQANKAFTIAETLSIDGRQAVTYHQTGQTDLHKTCLLEVEVKGGGLEISISNAETNTATGTQASCDIAKRLAGKLVPTFGPAA